MKNFVLFMLATMTISTSYAAVNCTQEPVSKWKDQEAFKKELEVKYKLKNFKVTPGNCYEIYGWDKKGNKVEIYFHPVTGKVIKQRG